MSNEKNELKLDMINHKKATYKYHSEHGTKYQNGKRYPDIPTVYGEYEYSFSIFDYFADFVYDEKLANDPNMKWPCQDEEGRREFARELIIDQVWKRHYNTLGNPFNYSTMAGYDYNHLMLCCNELDHKLNVSFRDFLDCFREAKDQKNTETPAAEEKDDKPNPRGGIRRYIPLLIILGGLAVATGITYKCWDLTHTSFDELNEMMDKEGYDTNKKIEEIVKLLPKQDVKLPHITVRHFPASDDEISKADENLRKLLEEKGTEGVVTHYLDLINNINPYTASKEDIADYFASSYMVEQLIPGLELCEAIEDYNRANPSNAIPTENVFSISCETRGDTDNVHGVYVITYKDSSKFYLTPSEYEEYEIGDPSDRVLNLDTRTSEKMEDLYTDAIETYNKGNTAVLISKMQDARNLANKSLNMIPSRPVLKKTAQILSSEELVLKTKGTPEQHFKDKFERNQ